jgi:DNA-directed RNA polymerase subunit RPC12/RpoP
MPRWIVICSQCGKEFTHTLVRDLTHDTLSRDVFASPPKPAIPEGGSQMNCPYCGGVRAYTVSDLRYRGN